MNKDNPRCNYEINSAEIRLIGKGGEMLGVMTPAQGIKLAREVGLDLVEISPGAKPPVCKLIDFGKYKYEIQKKAQSARKNQVVVLTKEIKIRPTIAEGDYQVKLRNAIRFLKDGNKIRISLMFKGREITHQEVGYDLMNRFKADIAEYCKFEVEPRMEGKQIFMLVAPK